MDSLPSPPDDPLVRRRSLPPGGAIGWRPMRDGWPVRTLHWPAADGRPTILLITGRADFAEKYAETLHELVANGWGVACFDWRGQGLSRRVGKTAMHGASPGFDLWLADLAELIDHFAGLAGGPLLAMAHSMGGHLLLRHLEGQGGGIARAVLMSPMAGLAAPPLGPKWARRVARWMVRRGHGSDYVWGGGPWQPGQPGSDRQRMLTGDVERYADESWWIGHYPALALGSVTWGWLAEAFDSIDAAAAPGLPEGVAVPLLALLPDRDQLVDSAATQALVARVPGAEVAVYSGAGHELLREVPAVRRAVLARILAFFEGVA